jgi:hypothetical protein
VRYIPGTTTVIAVGPSGADISTDDGRTWTKIEGPGFQTFAFAPNGSAGWGAGSLGRIAKLTGLEVKTPVMSDLVNRENW